MRAKVGPQVLGQRQWPAVRQGRDGADCRSPGYWPADRTSFRQAACESDVAANANGVIDFSQAHDLGRHAETSLLGRIEGSDPELCGQADIRTPIVDCKTHGT